jgi:phage terminase small subunit
MLNQKHTRRFPTTELPALKNPRHEAFAQALARGMSASAAYRQVGFKPHRANAATLARKEHISVRVAELQEEQLAIHQQATAAEPRTSR